MNVQGDDKTGGRPGRLSVKACSRENENEQNGRNETAERLHDGSSFVGGMEGYSTFGSAPSQRPPGACRGRIDSPGRFCYFGVLG